MSTLTTIIERVGLGRFANPAAGPRPLRQPSDGDPLSAIARIAKYKTPSRAAAALRRIPAKDREQVVAGVAEQNPAVMAAAFMDMTDPMFLLGWNAKVVVAGGGGCAGRRSLSRPGPAVGHRSRPQAAGRSRERAMAS